MVLCGRCPSRRRAACGPGGPWGRWV